MCDGYHNLLVAGVWFRIYEFYLFTCDVLEALDRHRTVTRIKRVEILDHLTRFPSLNWLVVGVVHPGNI